MLRHVSLIALLFYYFVGATTVLSQSKYKPYKPDEPAAQLQQLQLHGTTQLTTVNKAHQSAGKIQLSQKIDKQKNTADERVEELEKVFAEIQILKNQQSNTDSYLKDQLSLMQQQLSEVQKANSCLKEQLSEVQKDNSCLKDQLSEVRKGNAYLKDQLSLTQQQLSGVQSMMTCSRIWVVSRDDFTIGKEIGRGAWATVHETTFRGATVAAKRLHHLITSPRTRQLFQREMEMALQCQHQNIVTFLGATLEGPPVILMELMDTSLRSAYEHGNIKDHQVLEILCDTASALHFLHTRPDPVIHRDVSSANVLLKTLYNGEWLAKLGDLGTAKIQQQAATAGPGAIAYGAPEAADFTKHSPKMDVYSYGVLVLEVLTKTHPFQMVDALKAQVQQQFPHYLQLVIGCTNHQSSNRPTMYDVIEQLDRIKAARP